MSGQKPPVGTGTSQTFEVPDLELPPVRPSGTQQAVGREAPTQQGVAPPTAAAEPHPLAGQPQQPPSAGFFQRSATPVSSNPPPVSFERTFAEPVAPTEALETTAAGDQLGVSGARPQDYFGEGTFVDESVGGGLPELELGAPTGSSPQAASAPVSMQPAPPGADDFGPGVPAMPTFGGGDLDLGGDFDDFDQGNAMPLAVDMPDQSAGPRAGSADHWPTGKTPAVINVDPVEVRIVADYGEAPSSPLVAPVYAWRVFSRRRVLEQQVVQARQALEAVERTRDALLADMIDEIRPQLEATEQLASHLFHVKEVEKTAESRGEMLAGVQEEYGQKTRLVAQRRQEAQQRIVQLNDDRKHLLDEITVREETYKREEVHLKRIHIEFRAAREQAQRAQAAGQGVAPELTQRMQELQAEAARLKPGVDVLAQALEGARRPYQEAEQEIRQLQGQLQALTQQQQELDAAYRKQAGVREQGLTQSNQELMNALADVGRSVLATQGAVEIREELISAVTEADRNVEAHARELEKLVQALDCHDDERFKQGRAIGLGVVGVLVLLVLVLIVSVGGGDDAPAGEPKEDTVTEDELMEDF